MTLKEKFKQLIYPNHIHTNEISDWTDEFAIEFADWCIKNNLVEYYVLSILYKTDYKYSIEELLETFKKEKGL